MKTLKERMEKIKEEIQSIIDNPREILDNSENEKMNRYKQRLTHSGMEGFEIDADFNNFIISDNETVHRVYDACHAFVNGSVKNILIGGSVGGGKTHLACAIAKRMSLRKDLVFGVVHCATVDKSARDMALFPILIIDDICRETGCTVEKQVKRGIIEDIINVRSKYSNKITIYTTNADMKEMIETYKSHIYDRMTGNCVVTEKIIAKSYRKMEGNNGN